MNLANGPKRILFVSLPSGFSGAEQSLCQLISHLDQRRFRLFALLGTEGVFAAKLRTLNVEVVVADRRFGALDANTFLYAVATVLRLRPDLIHFNAMSGYPILFASLLAKVPIVTHLRNSEIAAHRELIRASTCVVTISELVKREALKLGVPSSVIKVLHNEVDTELFSPAVFDKYDCRMRLSLPASAKIALMIARFVPYKNHGAFLEAALEMKISFQI